MVKKKFRVKSFSDRNAILRLCRESVILSHISKSLLSLIQADSIDFRMVYMNDIVDIPVKDRLFSARKKAFYVGVKRKLKTLGFSIKEEFKSVQTHPVGDYLVWEITVKKKNKKAA